MNLLTRQSASTLLAFIVSVLVLASCTSTTPCAQRHPVPSSCPDLKIRERGYREWRAITKPPLLQEIDGAVYPACNIPEPCGGDDLFGLGATDVWRLEGVDPDKAVIALRQGTNTYAIFVRMNTDPGFLRPDGRRMVNEDADLGRKSRSATVAGAG